MCALFASFEPLFASFEPLFAVVVPQGDGAGAAVAVGVSASLSTRQIQTALQHDGPNQLSLW